jgi:hypothetical protein
MLLVRIFFRHFRKFVRTYAEIVSDMPTYAQKNKARRALAFFKRANSSGFGSSDRAAAGRLGLVGRAIQGLANLSFNFGPSAATSSSAVKQSAVTHIQ